MKQKPLMAFMAASSVALLIGIPGYNLGPWNARLQLNETGDDAAR